MARRKIKVYDHGHWNKEYFDELKLKDYKPIDMNINYIDDSVFEEFGEEIEPKENTSDSVDIAVDFNKIKAIKFSDKPKLNFYPIGDFVKMADADEAYLSYCSETNHFGYRYQLLNGFYPAIFRFEDYNVSNFINNLFKYYNVPDNSFFKISFQDSNEAKISSLLIAFDKDLLLFFDGINEGSIYYDISAEKNENSTFHTLLSLLKNHKKPKITKNKIYIVYKNQHGFEKIGFDVKKIKVDLKENYNDGFEEISSEIITGLNSKDKTNLVILPGEPGTGKCVCYNTKITIRNKKTGKIEEINITDLM